MKKENKSMTTQTPAEVELQGLATISDKVKESLVTIKQSELRYLVDAYYQSQDDRITKDGQVRAINQGFDGEGYEPPLALTWVARNRRNEEEQIKKMLDIYTDNHPVGKWAKDTIGIGPVLSAALIAYMDIDKCKHAGQFLSYAGQNDQNVPWLGADKASDIIKAAKAIHEMEMNLAVDAMKKTLEEGFGLKWTEFKNDTKALLQAFDKNKCTDLASIFFNEYIDSKGLINPLEADNVDDVFSLKQQKTLNKYIKAYGDFFIEVSETLTDDISRDTYMDARNELIQKIEYSHEIKDTDTIELISNLKDEGIVSKDWFIFPNHMKRLHASLCKRENYIYTNELLSDVLNYIADQSLVVDSVLVIVGDATLRQPATLRRNFANLRNVKKKDKEVKLNYTNLQKLLAKPPYNIDLKVICWKIGQSFMKVSGNEKSVYGALYKERKELEESKNSHGAYGDQIANALISKKWDKNKDTYKSYTEGKLTASHITARSTRMATRVFLTHFFEAMYIYRYHEAPPAIFPIAHMGHEDYIEPEVPFSKYLEVPDEYYQQYKIARKESDE